MMMYKLLVADVMYEMNVKIQKQHALHIQDVEDLEYVWRKRVKTRW